MTAFLLLAVAAFAVAAIATFLQERWGPSQAALERRYAAPASRFVVVDGVRLHYLDEGRREGIAIVFLPAQWADVAQWDAWVPELADAYRILRLDLPGHGLAGPIPSGDYSFEAYGRLLGGFLDALGLPRIVLVGTSFSGIVAFRYASAGDPRLVALVLAASSGLPRAPQADPAKGPGAPPPSRWHRWLQPYYRTRGFMRAKLESLVHDHSRLTPPLVRRFADMNNRRGRLAEAQARAASYKVGDPGAVLSRITVPTLVMGATGSTYLSAADADRFAALLTAAPVRKIVYPGTGHLIAIDAGAPAARDLRAFLDDLPGPVRAAPGA